MINFIEKYKIVLSVIFGTFFLIAANYAPALSLFLLTEREIEYAITNWIFLGLGILFLWGRIVAVAKSLNNAISKKLDK